MSRMSCLIVPERILDGSGQPAREQGAVLVENGRIAKIYDKPPPTSSLPSDCEVINKAGTTLLPGLIDGHVHLCLPGDGTLLPQAVAEPPGVIQSIALRNARKALHSGITTVRDCGGFSEVLSSLRRAINLDYAEGPRLVLAGWPMTTTGGHCHYFGGEADGSDGVKKKVRVAVKWGADYIKIMGSGGGTPGTISWLPSFSREEIDAAVQEAHQQARRVIVHCLCGAAIENAVAAGADEIAHAYFLVDADTNRFDESIARSVAKAGIIVASTLSVSRFVILAGDPDAERRKQLQNLVVENTAALRRAGVKLVAGSDAGWLYSPFNALHAELELMVQAGLSPLESIVAATSQAAAALGLDKVTGAIRPGLSADLLAVHGKPDKDVTALSKVEMVMKEGRRVV